MQFLMATNFSLNITRAMMHNSVLKLAVASVATVCFVVCSSFTPINTYSTRANFLAADNLGNFYSAGNNRIVKFNNDGKFLALYEEFKYGKVGMADVTNPMKILVYYPDFQTVVTLDRFLSPLSRYSFFDLGYQNVLAVGSSTDGRLWFYDNVDFKLKKIDETGKIFRESQPLNVLLNESPTPNFILERDNAVYVNDPNIGILVFDFFGSYIKTIPLKGLIKFQVLQQQIVFFENSALHSYNTFSLDKNIMTLPDTANVAHAVIDKNRLAVLKSDRVDFYSY